MNTGFFSITKRIGFVTQFLVILIFPPGFGEAKEAKPLPGAVPVAVRILDQKRIHSVYSEGDFETVIAAIDSFTQANKSYSQSDSVFIAKHLAVIYTANPATREKGKHYMFRLLSLLPSAKIVDMFVSDEIDHIFEKVREEYIVRQAVLGDDAPSMLESNQYATHKMTMSGNPRPKPGAGQATSAMGKSGSSSARYWIAGGVALVAIGSTAFYFLQPEPAADKNYVLPK